MKKLTCIICPTGCTITVERCGEVLRVDGNKCRRGYDFALNEMTNPTRTLCTTVKTTFEEIPRLPVKTSKEIPKNMINEVMREINKVELKYIVKIGETVIENILGTGADIIATCNMESIIKGE